MVSPPSAPPWRILCIDDDPDALAILRLSLSVKFEVVEASDGLEGLAMLDLSEPDFVICDIRMPNLDGFQTVAAIRRHPKYYDVPVFFLTAETDLQSARRAFTSGGNLFLTKPFEPMRVLQNIDYFLKEHGSQPGLKHLTLEQVQHEAQNRPSLTGRTPQPPQPVLSSTSSNAPVPDKDIRVLIICEVESQRARISTALNPYYECLTSADPFASLQQLFRYDPDILIINPFIPRISGMGLIQMIRQNNLLSNLPILILQDNVQVLDRRIVQSLTDSLPLPPNVSDEDTVRAVHHITQTRDFCKRHKRFSIEQLRAEEDAVRRQIETEKERVQRQQERLRSRYSRIQSFIDNNQ
ncbi:MAG TPA: response regulator [Candidatus Sumerlaeota bacterium]|nr:response regulator [Candidatus Sumerlaeota bacterium]HPS00935.1 response regulator [Candidatus Sumerlaeota bacterium]